MDFFSFFCCDLDTRSFYAVWILQRTSFSATHTTLCLVFKRTYLVIMSGDNHYMKHCLFGTSS